MYFYTIFCLYQVYCFEILAALYDLKFVSPTGADVGCVPLLEPDFVKSSSDMLISVKLQSDDRLSAGTKESVSYETRGMYKNDVTDRLNGQREGDGGAKQDLKKGENMFFVDVFKRFEGVFGHFNKRGRRVKRTSE